MMWKSLERYVIIQIKGRNAERFLNLALQYGARLREIRRESQDSICCQVRAADFHKLIAVRRRCRCSVKSVGRSGWMFRVFRLRFRKTLVAGITLLMLAATIGSTRIWIFRVCGNQDVPAEVVLRALETLGVRRGIGRHSFEMYDIASFVSAYDTRIAWAGASLEGVVLTVKIQEKLGDPPAADPDTPADVVALTDGEIVRILPFMGRAAVKKGDVVRQGDVLIRGDITREDADKRILVRAEGTVIALVRFQAAVTVAPSYMDAAESGATAEYFALYLGDALLSETVSPYESYCIVRSDVSGLYGLILPLTVVTGEIRELTMQRFERNMAEMTELAMTEAEQLALSRVPLDAAIVDKTGNCIAYEGCAVAVVVITAEQSIGITKEITD